MAEGTTGMTSTTNTGSPLAAFGRGARRKRKPSNFIKGAIKRPGSLHRALGVPQGQKIPPSKLAQAARNGSTSLKRKVNLARTLKSLN